MVPTRQMPGVERSSARKTKPSRLSTRALILRNAEQKAHKAAVYWTLTNPSGRLVNYGAHLRGLFVEVKTFSRLCNRFKRKTNQKHLPQLQVPVRVA